MQRGIEKRLLQNAKHFAAARFHIPLNLENNFQDDMENHLCHAHKYFLKNVLDPINNRPFFLPQGILRGGQRLLGEVHLLLVARPLIQFSGYTAAEAGSI